MLLELDVKLTSATDGRDGLGGIHPNVRTHLMFNRFID